MTSRSFQYPRRKSLRQAFAVQARVIHALILREMKTRFGRKPFGVLWAIVEPCLHVFVWMLVLFVIRGVHRAPVHGISPVAFICSGILPFFFFNKVARFEALAIRSNQALLQYPLVKHVDVIVARFLLEAAILIVSGVVIFGILIMLKLAPFPADPIGLFGASGLSFLLGFSFGAMNAVLITLFPIYDSALGLSQRLLYFSSGIFFSVESFPSAVQGWMAWNPALHGVELFRVTYFSSYRSSIISVGYVCFVSLCFLLMAFVLERIFREKLQA